MGAVGMLGSMACFLVLLAFLPEPTSLAEYARLRTAMGGIAQYVFLPSLGLTLVSGLMAIAATPTFTNSGWAMVKLASGIVLFEGSLMTIQGPMQRGAERSAEALSGDGDIAALGATLASEWWSLWVLIVVAIANVALGVWRPRFKRASS